MSYSVILPTLNEAGHIVELIKKINSVFLEIDVSFEIIVIDDDSSDNTDKLCNELIKNYVNFKFFSRKGLKKILADSINLGIQESIYENIIWMDADFQHPPDFFKQFHKHKDKYDVVIFSRFLKDSVRYFETKEYQKEINENQSVFFNRLCNFFLYKDITDYTSGFICIKKKILDDYQLKGYYGEYFIDLIIYCKSKKYSIVELPFVERKRLTGLSKTFPSFSFRYLILLFKYFTCLIKNIFNK
jgi:glycosyltransferase involved in cell wall biosynthesis